MKHMMFYKEIKEKIQPSYVFCGTEEYVKESALKALLDTIPLDAQTFNVEWLLESGTIGQTHAACQTLPVLSDRRFVILKDAKLFQASLSDRQLKDLQEMLETLPETTCLVVYFTGQPDKRRKAFALLQKTSTVVQFDPLDTFEAVRWVSSYAKKAGREMTNPDAQALVERMGTDVRTLKNQMDKLIAHAGGNPALTQGDFVAVTGEQVPFNAFTMLDQFLKGNGKKGMDMYVALIGDGVSPFMLMGAAASKLRGLYTAKSLLESGIKSAQVIHEMGGGFMAKQAVKACARYSFAYLKQAVDSFAMADYQIKNGVMKEDAAVELAMIKAFVTNGSAG